MTARAIGTFLSTRRGRGGPRRIAAAIVLVSLAGAAAAASAEVSEDVKLLPFRRALLGVPAPGAGTAGGVVEFAEDSLLAAGAAPDLRDVRVVNAAGEALPCRRVEPGFHDDLLVPIPGAGWSAPEDPAGAAGAWAGHLSLDLDGPGVPVLALESGATPWRWTIEGSPDGNTWAAASLLPWRSYLMHHDSDYYSYWIVQPPTARRLRVAFGEPTVTGALPPVALFRWERRPAPLVSAGFRVASAGFTGRTWRAVVEAEGGPRAFSTVRFAAPAGFDRAIARVEVRDEDGAWRTMAVEPAPIDGYPEASTPGIVRWTGPRGDAVRVTVDGGDPPNDPIRIVGLGWTPVRFRFRAAETPLWVAYGDLFVPAPTAVPEIAPPRDAAATVVSLGPPEGNPHYDPPGFGIRWLARRPAILTAAMIVTLALILRVALRPRSSGGEWAA